MTDLTPREREILVLAGQGLEHKEIAVALEISHFTVRSHLTAVRLKLGVHTTQAAVKAALQDSPAY